MSKIIEAAKERGTIVRLELALEGALALIESLKAQNINLRVANEAKHREIAEMDRRHVDAMYKLQCELRNLQELIEA